MAATRYFGTTSADGIQVAGGEFVGSSSGGTLAGSQVVQIVFDDSVFDATQEGKQRLLAAIELIEQRIAVARTWPIDSTS